MNRDELRKNIGRTFQFIPHPRRDTANGSWESDMNLWILRSEAADRKGFEFLNAIRDHDLLFLETVQIRNFDAPDKLVLRGQVVLKGASVLFEPFHPRPVTTPPVGVIDVPLKTMILIPVARQNALWWHMGTMGGQPVMQIVGDLNITNISRYGLFVMGAKLREPKAVGHALVRAHDSDMYDTKNAIPEGAISDLRFDFYVQPPFTEEGKSFKADVAIVDQFGNEHWLEGLEFSYL
jgi:hypothetical protein